jgi:segregation and condensation protein B
VTDLEATVNLTGDSEFMRAIGDQSPTDESASEISRAHLKGLLEALIFASESPIKQGELTKAASAQAKEVRDLLMELKSDYAARGVQLEEVAGGWIFRTNATYAQFIRELSKQKPVRLTRAQVETLAIVAYRQPITRPELDDIRGVDSGPVLKLLLERELVRILGKKDEPGRPILYGTTNTFLEFFGLKSLKDLPTLKEFTELNEDSRRVVERELGDVLEGSQPAAAVAEPAVDERGTD